MITLLSFGYTSHKDKTTYKMCLPEIEYQKMNKTASNVAGVIEFISSQGETTSTWPWLLLALLPYM